MLNSVIVIIVCVSLATSIFIEIYAIFRSQNYKKDYFILMQAMIILYLFGYLLELTSTNAEEAYTGVKVLYAGASFIATFAFFFVADFCDVKIHSVLIKAPLVLLSFAMAIVMATTKFHHLVYIDYGFDSTYINNLVFTPGPLYSIINTYPAVCLILALVVLLYQLKKWKTKYRKQILVFIMCIAIPFVADGIYHTSIIAGINEHRIYFTPISLAVMSLFLYLGVIRYNIFEIISIATVTAMEHIREGFVLVDENDSYLFSNPAAVKILPEIKKLAKGESIFTVMYWPHELDAMKSEQIEFTTLDEGIKYFRASVSPVFSKKKILIAKIILIGEVTDSVKLMKELENAAYIDALTGIYNRKHFYELANADIERALRLNQSIYTAMLDLDFFKNVNDTYGHAAGDIVLKTTAGVIRQTIRTYDLLCRYGGEEFVLLITDLDAPEAFSLMERIRENMEITTTCYEGLEIKVTCSIGLAKFVETDTLETSIRKSDEALYVAKNSGRNLVRIFCEQESPINKGLS